MPPFGSPFEVAADPRGAALVAMAMLGAGALALSQSALFLPFLPLFVLATVWTVSIFVDAGPNTLRWVGARQWQQVEACGARPVAVKGNFFTPWLVLVTVTAARRRRRLLLWRRGQERSFRHLAAALTQDATA
ncbi:MAG: hypothetical protein AAGA23_09400 [Pseudomonadota bacterium]